MVDRLRFAEGSSGVDKDAWRRQNAMMVVGITMREWGGGDEVGDVMRACVYQAASVGLGYLELVA
jgi:hypothetical protein